MAGSVSLPCPEALLPVAGSSGRPTSERVVIARYVSARIHITTATSRFNRRSNRSRARAAASLPRPRLYNITDTITIAGTAALEISGHGLPSLVVGAGFSSQKPMFVIDTSVNITLEDIALLGPAASANQPAIPGVVISNSSFVTIKRCCSPVRQRPQGACRLPHSPPPSP
jgi:hypothetical protein